MKQPLYQYAMEYQGRSPLPFHTPGHKGSLPPVFSSIPDSTAALDIPDDVCGFPGVLEESEAQAAGVYNTRKTFYLVNGGTAGVKAMLSATLKPGDSVIMGRNIHLSAVSALIQTGAAPVFIPVEYTGGGIPLNITPENVEKALEENSGAKAVFITTPSYFGVCADLRKIAVTAKKKGVPLLVDEAWGAHFPFLPGSPSDSIGTGADICVHGAHKTLPALTGTALLHVMGEKVDPDALKTALSMEQTSSPNMLFFLSLEKAIHYLHQNGNLILTHAKSTAGGIRKTLKNECPGFSFSIPKSCAFEKDPLKIQVLPHPEKTGITGFDMACRLINDFNIVPEMADENLVLLLITGFEKFNPEPFLINAIKSVYQILLGNGNKIFPRPAYPVYEGVPQMAMPPRDAHYAKGKTVLLKNSVGKTAKRPVVPYPPGIPAVITGERFNSGIVGQLQKQLESGAVIRGIERANGEFYVMVTE